MNLMVIYAILAACCLNLAFPHRWSTKRLSLRLQETCRSGDGSSYRGFVSESAFSRKCLNWDRFTNRWRPSSGLGDHNYCRNPDRSLMPWCHVRRGRKFAKEFCDIPTCSPPTVSYPAAVDTELTCGERFENRMAKIVGGTFASVASHPWIAAIFHKSKGFLCGGSLIAPCWVVTAAHCFDDEEKIKIQDLSVYLGKNAINETDADKEQSFIVEKHIIHQKYKSNYNNDIALLKIKSRDGECALRSASVRTVCFPPYHTKLPAGIQCSIAGFGRERHMAWHFSQYLKEAKVKMISQADCRNESHYGDLITKNMFCAGSPNWSVDSCQGDSGGPLACDVSGRMFLFGVVSWGDGCASRNKPGVYTQVTNYNKWIAAKTGLSKFTRGFMYPTK
ncbi:plasminogen activator, urokinase a [Brachionichthys hirsutus]|uniref:plasminogen activator, urokinase a n=1 Tax=Brachionichthys hirsutus TaxID=412623 RepID=UPI0036053F91